MSTDILVVEFRPSAKDALGRLVKAVTGQDYAHTGMVVDQAYYELDGRMTGGVMRYLFKGVDELKVMRGRKTGADDTLEFYALPRETTVEDVRALTNAWDADIAANIPFGWGNMITFMFKIPYRRLSAWVLDKFGWRWPGVEKVFVSHWLCCSAKVDEKLCGIGIDLYPGLRDQDVYPGMFARVLKRMA